MKVSGHIIDIPNRRIFTGELEIKNGIIASVSPKDNVDDCYILPGFIDAHVHIESSMLVPSEFARMAVVHGTVATVSDPHEIGNVLGIEGVRYMIENGSKVPFKFYFGAPSCVPATPFETAGATIGAADVDTLLRMKEVHYLAEMMNWPGVLFNDPLVREKIALAARYQKPVDGHAPGLVGDKARQYAAAGITTDHECFKAREAIDKLKCGMKIIIREGSAAKNFEALHELITEYPADMMFCSDDKHPDSLEEGHINLLVKRALQRGIDLFKVLQVACINPVHHYRMNVGLLRMNDPADFIIVDNPRDFNVLETYVDGKVVARNGKTLIDPVSAPLANNFVATLKQPSDFALKASARAIRVIQALDGQLITHEIAMPPKIENGFIVSDLERDILKIVVVNRYKAAPPAIGFIKNFELKRGAIASSVAHDSHNVIAVGVDDQSIAAAVNLIIESNGGVSAVDENGSKLVPLPIAGLMSADDGYKVARQYKEIDQMAKNMGSTLGSPYMTLSFMALLVIPSLKLSDKGLFNGDRFEFTDLIIP